MFRGEMDLDACCAARGESGGKLHGKHDFTSESPYTLIKFAEDGDATSIATYIQNLSNESLDIQAQTQQAVAFGAE